MPMATSDSSDSAARDLHPSPRLQQSPGVPRAAAGTHVVVVGAGFAGLAVMNGLEDTGIKVTLVDRHYYTTFQPLLYQVATAGLDAGDVAFSARALVRHRQWADFRQGDVTGVDWEGRQVLLSDGDKVPYDFLVLAAGAVTNYFGVEGAEQHALAIYTLDDALAVRSRLYHQLEAANANPDRDGVLTFVVVGGGATGVEMAGALAELLQASLFRDYPRLDRGLPRVVLVERMDHLLTAFDKSLRRYTLSELSRRGVEVRLGESVAKIGEGQVVLGSGEVIQAGVVVWGAGVAASPLAGKLGARQTVAGRLVVEDDLRLSDHPEVFAVGDIAAAPDPSGGVTPQLAQPAIQTGAHAAEQIKRLVAGESTTQFRYHDKGIMATIGRHAAVAQLGKGIDLRGTPAWIAWLALHLLTLLGARNRLTVLVNWSWRYLSWSKGPRLIVGAETGRLTRKEPRAGQQSD